VGNSSSLTFFTRFFWLAFAKKQNKKENENSNQKFNLINCLLVLLSIN